MSRAELSISNTLRSFHFWMLYILGFFFVSSRRAGGFMHVKMNTYLKMQSASMHNCTQTQNHLKLNSVQDQSGSKHHCLRSPCFATSLWGYIVDGTNTLRRTIREKEHCVYFVSTHNNVVARGQLALRQSDASLPVIHCIVSGSGVHVVFCTGETSTTLGACCEEELKNVSVSSSCRGNEDVISMCTCVCVVWWWSCRTCPENCAWWINSIVIKVYLQRSE